MENGYDATTSQGEAFIREVESILIKIINR
jgi:hypothetical protein